MKPEVLTTVRNWVAGCVLLIGLIYSVTAITVNAKPAYASTCNCAEESAEAEEYCTSVGSSLLLFQCPIGGPPDGPVWIARCANGIPNAEVCSGT
jgi:hypothetical protein